MKTMINRQTPIKIIDRHFGSGKTTAMIDGFSNDNNYLVVVPYKTEIERVIKQSTKVTFVQPDEDDNNDRTKRESFGLCVLDAVHELLGLLGHRKQEDKTSKNSSSDKAFLNPGIHLDDS
mgnify:CR=1 FL=1